MNSADVIVVGLGGMGTATAWRLAQRGLRVIGLEQFAIGHDQGSSHGHTRIIRQAYYEHPAYVPLVRRAYDGWYDLEQARGAQLLVNAPCLTVGRAECELISGVRRSAEEHRLPVEELSAEEVQRRYPAFRLSAASGVMGLVEHTAGLLMVDACVQAMAAEARQLGARLFEKEPVRDWQRQGQEILVRTSRGAYTCQRLVITAGPWAGRLLGSAGQSLKIMRQVVMWFEAADLSLFRRDRFPLFITDTPQGVFYGMPALDRRGPKIARHYGAAELAGPEGVERTVSAEDERTVRDFVRTYLPGADGRRNDASVCLYTLTPDRHFLIDRHEEEEVVFAAGFSGHGFKFAPVVGEVLADLAMTGGTKWPTELFRRRR